ncbi:plasmid stabilization system protein [Herbaspirillum sp. GW103]|uniref:hypothetical protein n=1 Tax=unclassified Herbaspirillum TaxID=2624150 RepID=UPI00025E5083|nr:MULTISPECIES: hypothetical protein [unclassified Herbaspirillum]EIJ45850.1 plasmid stabilization system protein [Herbaspirillum sp. GW103]MCI1003261.1 plasmid stabilization protein [Herbaspirillum sp. C7C8]
MPQAAWSKKRERQYQHIKSGAMKRGTGIQRAEEIAARTVNKERAQHGESKKASKTSTQDMPASRRGGLRSHTGSGGPTYKQLYAQARTRGIKGRSTMNKAALQKALSS